MHSSLGRMGWLARWNVAREAKKRMDAQKSLDKAGGPREQVEVIEDHPDQARYGMRVPVECYSRIVGYMRPVQQWNVGKKQEWKDRVPYEQPTLRDS